MRKRQKKALYKRERDSLEGPHDKEEIHRKALREGKNFGLQRRNMFRKGKSAVEGDPKKSWSGIETEWGVDCINQKSPQRGGAVSDLRTRLGWVKMAVGLPVDPSYTRHSSRYIVVICCCDDRLFSRAVICSHTV